MVNSSFAVVAPETPTHATMQADSVEFSKTDMLAVSPVSGGNVTEDVGNVSVNIDALKNDLMNARDFEGCSGSSGGDAIPVVSCVEDPFEGVLVWPRVDDKINGSKRRKQEHVPSVATSGRWLQWYNKKDSEKRQEELEKKARIEKRKMVKQQKEKQKEEQKLDKIEKKRQKAEQNEMKKAEKENAKTAKTKKQLKRGKLGCKLGPTDKNKTKPFLKIKIG